MIITVNEEDKYEKVSVESYVEDGERRYALKRDLNPGKKTKGEDIRFEYLFLSSEGMRELMKAMMMSVSDDRKIMEWLDEVMLTERTRY